MTQAQADSPQWAFVERVMQEVRAVLTPDLLHRDWRGNTQAHPMQGHCYHASESTWWLCGGPRSFLVPRVLVYDHGDGFAINHWFLADVGIKLRDLGPENVVDPTADQFPTTPNYARCAKAMFSQAHDHNRPSRRGAEVIKRVEEARAKQAVPR